MEETLKTSSRYTWPTVCPICGAEEDAYASRNSHLGHIRTHIRKPALVSHVSRRRERVLAICPVCRGSVNTFSSPTAFRVHVLNHIANPSRRRRQTGIKAVDIIKALEVDEAVGEVPDTVDLNPPPPTWQEILAAVPDAGTLASLVLEGFLGRIERERSMVQSVEEAHLAEHWDLIQALQTIDDLTNERDKLLDEVKIWRSPEPRNGMERIDALVELHRQARPLEA
jgi:hypothetical protein